MSDNIQLPNTTTAVATDEVNGAHLQKVKLTLGGDGDDGGTVSNFNPMPVKLDAASLAALENIQVTVENPTNAGLTDTQLRASPLNVTVSNLTATGLTNTELRASPLTVTVSNPAPNGLTDTQLRASAVPVSIGSQPLPTGASTEATLAALKGVIDGLKATVDALNAKVTAVNTSSIAGEVSLSAPTLSALENTTVTVSNPTAQGLTDTQLRASAIPISLASQPLPNGASTETTLAALKTAIDNLNAKVTAVNTGAVTLTNPTAQGLTDTQLRATPLTVSVDNQTALTNTQLRSAELGVADISMQFLTQEIKGVNETIKDMLDSILYVTHSMLEKMARLDRFDRMTVQVSDNAGNELNSPYYGVAANLVGESTTGRTFSRMNEPWNFSNAGSAHIYNQLTITN